MHMKIFVPDYYPKFHCIANHCRDNCCLGWEIDIDADTYAKYKHISGEFGRKLRENICALPTPHFLLCGKDQRCPFLNKQNLCEIYICLGKNALCRICSMHPRYIEQFDNFAEIGIGLACESAAFLILSQKEPMQLIKIEGEPPFADQPILNTDFCDAVFYVRKQLMALLQNRKIPMPIRLLNALLYCRELQYTLETAQDFSSFFSLCHRQIPDHYPLPAIYFDIQETWSTLLNVFCQTEYMDTKWHDLLDSIFQEIHQGEMDFLSLHNIFCKSAWLENFYEQFCVYLLFRYFAKCVFDGEILLKLQWIITAYLLLYSIFAYKKHIHHELNFSQACRLAQIFSKEIEYSEQNLDTLYHALSHQELFDPLRLAILLVRLCP